MEEKTKVCKKCGRELPLSEFPKNRHSKDGYLNTCKTCRTSYEKSYRHTVLEKARLYDEITGNRGGGLSAYSPRQLMQELYSRGYRGTLTYTETKTINLETIND